MPTLLIYGLMILAILGALGGIGYKVRESGKDAVRVEWAEANAAAKEAANAERARQDALRQAQDAATTKRLSDAKRRSDTLLVSLNAHIKASGAAADCPMPSLLLDDWNAANSGKGVGPGTVPSPSRTATPAR